MAYQPVEFIARKWLPRISIICTLILFFEGAGNAQLPASGIASHGVERDAVNADWTGVGGGYFTFIAGVPGTLFSRVPRAATAFFMATSDPVSTVVVPNVTL